MARFSSHPMFSIAQLKAMPATVPTDSGLKIPHSTKATIKEAVTAKMTLSMRKFRS